MPHVSIQCPEREQLYRLLLGQVAAPQSEVLAVHLEQCERCANLAGELWAEDDLVEAARTPPPPFDIRATGVVRDLMEHLRLLGQPRNTRADLASQATTATAVPAESAPADAQGKQGYDFLAPPRRPGEIGWLGGYRVVQVLGTGGMGIVFQAEDTYLRRSVALKVMRPALSGSDEARRRFLREARLAAALEHEHVVTIYQVGEESGVQFLAMQWLRGLTLEEFLRQHAPLRIPLAIRLGRQIARGLAAAHERGLVHRDIKPTNLWLEERPGMPDRPSAEGATYHVKILDFGLARAVEDDAHLTQSGFSVGTPAYMAPEQFDGKEVDCRCDLFGLGVVLYRMCTGELPFPGKNARAILATLASEQPKPVRDRNPAVPAELAALIEQLLAKDAAARPASAAAAADRLQAMEETLRAPAAHPPSGSLPREPVGPRPSGGRASKRRVLVAAVALAAFLPLTFVFGGDVVRFATNRGEIVIEVDDPDTAVTVKEGGAVILDRKGQRTVTLTVGEHELELTVKDAAGEVHVPFTTKVVLTRGGKEVINIRQELARATTPAAQGPRGGTSAAAGPAAAGDAERRVAVWVLSAGGRLRLTSSNGERLIISGRELPATAFKLVDIDLNGANRPIDNSKVTDAHLATLEALPNLRGLDLRTLPITDSMLKYVEGLRNLQGLSLHSTEITDAGLERLAGLTKLSDLNVGNTPIGDAGLKHLSALTNLKRLDLAGTRVSDAGLRNLESLIDLQGLALDNTRVSDTGLEYVRALKSLRILGIEGTRVTDAGLKHVATLTALRYLNLNHTCVSDAGLKQLEPMLLYGLELNGTQVGDTGLRHVAALYWTLESLYLSGTQVGDAGLEQIRGLKKLKVLEIVRTRVSDAGLAHLQALTELQHLNLADTHVDDAGLVQLGRLKKLQSLSLSGCGVTDAGLSHLYGLAELRDLDLGRTEVTAAGVTALRKALPVCKIAVEPKKPGPPRSPVAPVR